MLDLALHIIKKKAGQFDPTKFDDRYDAALWELVKAKIEGRKIAPPKVPEPTKRSDLLEALRQSAGAGGATTSPKRKTEGGKQRGRKPASGAKLPKQAAAGACGRPLGATSSAPSACAANMQIHPDPAG
jgi:DNA end-binding protein Ku